LTAILTAIPTTTPTTTPTTSLPLALCQAIQPTLPPLSSASYSGWRLTRLAEANARPVYVGYKEHDDNHTHPTLRLLGSQTVLCEGYWPFRPSFEPKHVLAGTCLYTAAWSVHFASVAGGNRPRSLSLGLPGDLERIEKLLKNRRQITTFQIPTQPANYHRKLIAWQAEILQRYPSIETIEYTLPLYDYHGYIMHFEEVLGQSLPGLHRALDEYVQIIKDFMQEVWGDAQMAKLSFDLPGSPELKKEDIRSRENDLQLYLSAVGKERVMGIEDLPEVALAHEVAWRSGSLIPCAVAVLDLPDPYLVRDDASAACRYVSIAELQ
jgi:hypothetical protein